MNIIPGEIKKINQSGAIILADIEVDNYLVSAMLIDSPNDNKWIKTGQPVHVIFKETEVSLAKNLSGKISLRNRFQCIVNNVEKGELLSKVHLTFQSYKIASVITTRALDDLAINVGDQIEAFVKANEVSLMKKKSE